VVASGVASSQDSGEGVDSGFSRVDGMLQIFFRCVVPVSHFVGVKLDRASNLVASGEPSRVNRVGTTRHPVELARSSSRKNGVRSGRQEFPYFLDYAILLFGGKIGIHGERDDFFC
jgi:hypothetical protein